MTDELIEPFNVELFCECISNVWKETIFSQYLLFVQNSFHKILINIAQKPMVRRFGVLMKLIGPEYFKRTGGQYGVIRWKLIDKYLHANCPQ